MLATPVYSTNISRRGINDPLSVSLVIEVTFADFCRQHTSDIDRQIALVLGFAGVPNMAQLNLWWRSIAMPKPSTYREQSN